MEKLLHKNIAATAMVAVSMLAGSGVQAFSTTEAQLHFGDGYRLERNGLDETARTTITLEHFTAFEHGDVFFFVDLFSDHDGPSTNTQSSHYGEIYGHLNGSALGLSFGESGFISDIGPDFGINQGDDFLVGLYGLRASFKVPGFNVFTFGVYAYDNVTDPFDRNLDTTYQATFVWNAPFEVGSQKFSAQGFVDFIGDQGAGVDSQIVFSPQLRWDIGHAFGGAENKYNLGLEYTHFNNKFGVTGVHENSVSVFIAMKF